MGRVWDFAKRRIVGYLVFWIVLFVVALYKGDQPAQAGIFILAFALTVSYAYTSGMKRRQRERREPRNGRLANVRAPGKGTAACLPRASGGAPSLS